MCSVLLGEVYKYPYNTYNDDECHADRVKCT